MQHTLSIIPRGDCDLWQAAPISFYFVSDTLIAIAYLSILSSLIYFVRRKSTQNPFRTVLRLAILFVLACLLEHGLSVWTLWFPHFWALGIAKLAMGFLAGWSAIQLWTWGPRLLALRSPRELEKINYQLSLEVKERQRHQQALQQVLQGTAGVTGADFFAALAKNLASALSTKYGMIAQLVDGDRLDLRVLAAWPVVQSPLPELIANAIGTPCEQVLTAKKPQQYLNNVQKLFPQAEGLREANAQSYIGVPMKDHQGRMMGVLCVYHDEPIQNGTAALAVMELFAEKAAAELQRQQVDALLRQANSDLEERVRDRTADLARANWHLRRLASCAQTTTSIIYGLRRSLNLDQIMATVTTELRKALECDRVLVYQFEPDWSGSIIAEAVANGWKPCLTFDPEDERTSFFHNALNNEHCIVRLEDSGDRPFTDTHLQDSQGNIWQQDVDYISISDVHTAKFSDCYLKMLEQIDARAYLIIPVYVNNKLWGFLASYQNSKPYEWDAEDIQMAVQVGSQLGVAIQQTNLLNTTLNQAAELRRAKESADAANHAKSDFLAHMSHELRTPLNAILGFAQLLRQDQSLSAQQRHYTKIINSSGEHLLGLINNVLDMSKIEARQLQRYDSQFEITPFLSDILSALSLRARQKGLSLTLERATNLPKYVCTDKQKLRQILFNLLSNAVKFTETGYVCLTAEVISETTCTDQGNASTYSLKFTVEDSGPGIDPSEFEYLFNPFRQTKTGLKSAQGTGLGLPICHRFTEFLGGELTVESELGEGTQFILTLPLPKPVPLPAPAIAAPPSQSPRKAAKPLQVMLVAPTEDDLALVKHCLSPLKFNLQLVQNCKMAFSLWQAWQPDVVFMEMSLVRTEGASCIRQIRQAEKNRPAESRTRRPPTAIWAIAPKWSNQAFYHVKSLGGDNLLYRGQNTQTLKIALHHHLNQLLPPTYKTLSPWVNSTATTLASDDLKPLPLEWVRSLHQAASQCSDTQIKALLKHLLPDHSAMVQVIADLAAAYEFDLILDATTPLVASQSISTGV